MSREKQIEKMTKAIDQAKYDMWVGKAHQSGDFTNHSKNIATALYNAGYHKQTEWISVEDRLPNDNDRVLCFDPNSIDSNLGAVSVQFGWCCKCKHMNITHWMPLPEAPKKGGAE